MRPGRRRRSAPQRDRRLPGGRGETTGRRALRSATHSTWSSPRTSAGWCTPCWPTGRTPWRDGLLEPITVACFEAGARHDECRLRGGTWPHPEGGPGHGGVLRAVRPAAHPHAGRTAHGTRVCSTCRPTTGTPTSRRLLDAIPFTPLFNVTGGPAASVPLGWSDGGLPIGVQFGASVGAEATVLRLAGELEQAEPWHDRI